MAMVEPDIGRSPSSSPPASALASASGATTSTPASDAVRPRFAITITGCLTAGIAGPASRAGARSGTAATMGADRILTATVGDRVSCFADALDTSGAVGGGVRMTRCSANWFDAIAFFTANVVACGPPLFGPGKVKVSAVVTSRPAAKPATATNRALGINNACRLRARCCRTDRFCLPDCGAFFSVFSASGQLSLNRDPRSILNQNLSY